ncbi:zinc finger protein 148-like isoform X2 [Dreissena polymorpha]|uniref:zinc finger protein 148-like isoform X2 n=1 Tax=Dreissena polymorpha TaxID=45954 RepID=UPI0022642347|nr:zinc finger protein 148-like isoform X2 [Dreissena polymorpha]
MEKFSVKIEPGQSAGNQKTLSINQIAAQLANSKASQANATSIFISPASGSVFNGLNNNNNNIIDAKEGLSGSPIVGKMTEALSLKQSPTLTTKMFAKTSASASVQVVTQYMCRYCGQQFESTDQMQKHIQEHVEGKTPHECSVCGKTYRTPSKLQRHVRVHSGERPYACSICGRRFTRSDHVKQHMKVHMTPKESNVCHLCNNMKFSKRQALHLHLQQQHLLQQVFTCHRCGEAFESLEEMQTHKLCHDAILNSMKDGNSAPSPPEGIARFAIAQKADSPSGQYDFVSLKTETTAAGTSSEDSKTLSSFLKMPAGGYIPANLDNVTALSNKLLAEGMEKLAKEKAELELQKKYHEEYMQLNADAKKYQDAAESEAHKKLDEEERRKIAQAFTINKSRNFGGNGEIQNGEFGQNGHNDGVDVQGKETTHMVNGEGMSMFILPTLLGLQSVKHIQKTKEVESDMETEDSEQNSSKDSAGINREGDDEKSEEESSEQMDDSGVADVGSNDALEAKISSQSELYTKPCPRSKKPGYLPQTKNNASSSVEDSKSQTSSKPMLSILNPKINELIKAKVEHNMYTSTVANNNQTTYIVSNQGLSAQLPKLTLIPNFSSINPAITYQSLLTSPMQTTLLAGPTGSSSSAALAAVAASAQNALKKSANELLASAPMPPKLIKCEHCCIYFEDNAMSMLHNTLHTADNTDPFTCRKCYKKLGNRLEFMAHMIWHLEPNMDLP